MLKFFLSLFFSVNLYAQVDVSCWNEDCLKSGWTWSDFATSQFNYISCIGDGCDRTGWIANQGSGKYYAKCKDKGCFIAGWYEIDQATQNLRNQVVCRSEDDTGTASDCFKYGWIIYGSLGQEAVISCFAQDCQNRGWLVQTSTRLVRVQCKLNGCWKSGWLEF